MSEFLCCGFVVWWFMVVEEERGASGGDPGSMSGRRRVWDEIGHRRGSGEMRCGSGIMVV